MISRSGIVCSTSTHIWYACGCLQGVKACAQRLDCVMYHRIEGMRAVLSFVDGIVVDVPVAGGEPYLQTCFSAHSG